MTAGKTATMTCGEGRTIVVTTPWGLHREWLAADILGRKVLGWEVDRQNRTAYLYLERSSELPEIHLVNGDDFDGSWLRRLHALDAMPASAAKHRLTPIEKLAAWFSGRRPFALVQKGGAA